MEVTYNILGTDGHEYGPATLEQLKGWVREGRVIATTHVSRSDQEKTWLTAASYPELGIQAQAVPAAKPAASDVDQYKLQQRFRSGASWFYWIAGLSLVNTILSSLGSNRRFVIGLGMTEVVDYIAKQAGATGGFVPLAIDVLIVGMFAFFGYKACQHSRAAFLTGMIVYVLDAGLLLLAADYFSVAFHGLALSYIFKGFSANNKLLALVAASISSGLSPAPIQPE